MWFDQDVGLKASYSSSIRRRTLFFVIAGFYLNQYCLSCFELGVISLTNEVEELFDARLLKQARFAASTFIEKR